MEINVILSGAFSESPEIRSVFIDEEGKSTIGILEEVFQNGQNLFSENAQTRSVSVGDMIEYNKEYYIVSGLGFIKQGEVFDNDPFLGMMLRKDTCNGLVKEKFGYLVN